MGLSFLADGAAAGGAEFDALLVAGAFDDAVDVDTRGVDQVGIELADLDEFLDLGDGHRAAGGDHRVEVAGCLAVDQVARPVPFPCLDDGQVSPNAFLQNIFRAIEDPGVFTLGQVGPEAGAGVEARNAGPAGAQLLRERALRRQQQVELTGQHLALELLVLAHVGGDHLRHLTRVE